MRVQPGQSQTAAGRLRVSMFGWAANGPESNGHVRCVPVAHVADHQGMAAVLAGDLQQRLAQQGRTASGP
jgi:hypothetical protein